MDFKEREKLIGFLKYSEGQYPIDKWLVDGISIWPIVKISSFFISCRNINVQQKKVPVKRLLVKALKIFKLDVLYSLFWMKKIKISKAKYIFAGFSGHRVMWKDSFFNRYFDPIMDEIEGNYSQKALIFEYDEKTKKNYYRSDRVIDITKLIHYFRFTTKNIKFENDKLVGFDDFLAGFQKIAGIESSKLQVRISDEINNILAWKNLWLYVLEKTQAEYAFVLCYYHSIMYGLIWAARERGVKTIDMQHGGQGAIHSAYNFTKIPVKGFELLPDYFWTWDKPSADNIRRFTMNTPHKIVMGGNPWIDYLKGQELELGKSKIILYTLQTTLAPVLHNYVMEAIKNTPDDYTWWLRLHPRMTKIEMEELYNTLETENILHRVEIKKATSLPLPIILFNCSAHVSHYSGSIIEAALMNVPVNIIMGNTGKVVFKDVLDKKEAVYFDPDNKLNLFSFIREQEANGRNRGEENNTINQSNYKTTFRIFE